MKKIKVVDEEILNSAFFDEELTFWKSGVGVFMLNKEDRQQQSVDVHLFLLVKKFWRVASKKKYSMTCFRSNILSLSFSFFKNFWDKFHFIEALPFLVNI